MITVTFFFLFHLVPQGQGYDAEILSRHTSAKECKVARAKVTTMETACVRVVVKKGE